MTDNFRTDFPMRITDFTNTSYTIGPRRLDRNFLIFCVEEPAFSFRLAAQAKYIHSNRSIEQCMVGIQLRARLQYNNGDEAQKIRIYTGKTCVLFTLAVFISVV